MLKKWLIIPVLTLLLVATACGTKNTNNPESADTDTGEKAQMKTIKIGTISPLSGDAAAYGEQIARILDFHLPTINKRAEKSHVTFELIHEDGKCTGSDAVNAYQKLVDIDEVSFIIGGACSSETLAIGPLTESGDVLALSPASSNPIIEGVSPYLFTFSYSDDTVGKTLADQMAKHKKVAIITEQNDFNIGVRDVWQKEMEQKEEVDIVANEVFPKGAADFRVILEKVKKTQPDAILLNPNIGVTSQNLVKQLAEIQGWEDLQLYGLSAYMNEDSINAAPKVVEGMVVVDSPKITNPELLGLIEKIEEEKGKLNALGPYYTASTYDVFNILTNLIIEHGENPEKVRNALAESTYDGYIGKIHFGNKSFVDVGGGIYIINDGTPEFQQ